MTPLAAGAALALLRRPDLWPVAVRTALRLAPKGWWRRWPPRPWPDGDYLEFRLSTMYGSQVRPRAVTGPDLVVYLEWCRRLPGRAR